MPLDLRYTWDRLIHRHRRHLRRQSACFHQTVVTSTCFWRNEPQLQTLCKTILPRMIDTLDRPVRVAIHAGSIGCEAISLAIAAAETGILDRLQLVSFDIDPDAVAIAQRGVYRPHYFLEPGNTQRMLLPQQLLEKYFIGDVDRELTVCPEIALAIDYGVCDSTEAQSLQQRGTFDLVMFQNAIPHLTAKAANHAVESLSHNLSALGLLALGGTQGNDLTRLVDQFSLVPVHTDDEHVYNAWSNRQQLWHRNPEGHLGLEPYACLPDAPASRYAHLFCQHTAQSFWNNLQPSTIRDAA